MSGQQGDFLSRLQSLLNDCHLSTRCAYSQCRPNINSLEEGDAHQWRYHVNNEIHPLIHTPIGNEEFQKASTLQYKEEGLPSNVLAALATLQSAIDNLYFQVNTYQVTRNVPKSCAENACNIRIGMLGMRNRPWTDEAQCVSPEAKVRFDQRSNFIAEHLVQLVERNYGKPALSLLEVSTAVHLSSRHVGRLFYSSQGRSFRDFLRRTRIHKACELLESSRNPIKVIAGMVGYNYCSHFGKDFRRLMGCTPAQYRVQQQTGPYVDGRAG